MPKTVLDATVLVSAFLKSGGLSDELLRRAREGAFVIFLSEDIVAEVRHTLSYPRIRMRYAYTDDEIVEFCERLRDAVSLVPDLPALAGISRDPNDDMVVATAVRSHASYIVTRDHDLLSLGTYEGITMITPESFMTILREEQGTKRTKDEAETGETS
jgi:putative PIN family toxin of toxin-antitoxin system